MFSVENVLSRRGVEPAVSLSFSHLGTDTSRISLRSDDEVTDEDVVASPNVSPPSTLPSLQPLIIDEVRRSLLYSIMQSNFVT